MTEDQGEDPGGTTLRLGERVQVNGADLSVTELDLLTIPQLRERLIAVSRRRGTTTYGALKSELGLRHAVNGLGRVLDLLSEDCRRRGEPSLAALVVTQGSGEGGAGAQGDAEVQRQELYEHWVSELDEERPMSIEFVLNGTRRELSAETVRARVIPTPPDPVRTHWVEIDGRRWPPKQAFRTALGITDEPFISHFAIRAFRRLGFATSELPAEIAGRVLRDVSQEAPSVLEPDDRSSLADEDAMLAFRQLDSFLSAAPLTKILGALEASLADADRDAAGALAAASGFDEDLVDSALVVRERVGMLDTLIHAAVITQVLPMILGEGERVLNRPSLGAGNDPERVYDLETTHRVAEFKLSSWKGADGGRQRSLFADVVGLSLDDSGRSREVYVVGSRATTFLRSSNRNAAKTLSKAALRVRQPAGLTDSMTVSEFTAAAGVSVIDLVELLPRLR